MIKFLYKMFLLIFTALYFGCQTTTFLDKPPVKFEELWKADTCGMKGYREFLVRYIDKNKYNVLEGKPVEYIEHYFGKPDTEILSEKWNIIQYGYNCSASKIKENGKCDEPNSVSYFINLNAKTKKVIDAVIGLH